MPTIAEVRAKYPQYSDMSDSDLAGALHKKYYSDMPQAEFNAKIGLQVNRTTPKTDRLPMSWSAAAKDVGRSAASGVRQGLEALAGAAGSANQATGDAAEWVAGKLGVGPEMAGNIGEAARRLNFMPAAPTTEQVRTATEGIIGKPYAPQTTAGDYAETIGEFAPSMVLGPGGAARKTAMTVVPAVLSETAGQLTEGTSLEPAARIAGGLAGGALTAGKNPSALKLAAKEAPTAEALKQTVDNGYKTLREVGIQYHPGAYAQSVQNMASDLTKAGFRPSTAETAFKLVDDLTAEVGKARDFDDINALVSSVGETARDLVKQGKNQQAAAVNLVRDRLMQLEESAQITSRIPLDRDRLNQVRGEIRGLALRNIKERTLNEIVQNAETYQSGAEAGIRNGISNLLRSKRGQQMFKGEERKALLEVAQGRKGLRTLSRFGFDLTKLSGNATALPALGAVAAGYGAGPLAGAGLAVAGTAAKAASPFFTGRALEQARAAIRSGKLRDNSTLNEASAEKLRANIRRLLAAGSSLAASQ